MTFTCYNPSEGGLMANLTGVVRELRKQRERAQQEVKRLDSALAALAGLNRTGVRRGRMSVAARKRIAAAQRARWAKWKKEHKQS